jgi:ribosomal protein L16 Arg81 hydroxylase
MKKLRLDREEASTPPLFSLISPLSPNEFFGDHWDHASVFIAGTPRRFDTIVNAHDYGRAMFDAKLGDRNFRFLNKAIGDREESLDFFLRRKAAWSQPPTMDDLAQELHKGTLVYVGIDQLIPSAKAFCRGLLTDLKCQMCINAYFSAGPDASAFDAHFDPQDVFILQLEGEKEWRLWERQRIDNPISGYPPFQSTPQPQLPADETILMTPGDLLYLPRGTWHWPRSLDDRPSLHLTLTLVAPRPMDVIHWLVELMSNEPDLRAALPVSKYQNGGQQMSEQLDYAMTFLSDKLALPEAKSMATAYMLQQAIKSVMPRTSAKSKGLDAL